MHAATMQLDVAHIDVDAAAYQVDVKHYVHVYMVQEHQLLALSA